LSDSDEHLIEQFRATGHIVFLEEVLQRHLRPIRGMVFQMVLNHDAADDVTQDIFLRVVRGIERFEGRSAFSTWLFRIAMNTVHSYIKSRGASRFEFCNELPAELIVSRLAPDGPVLQAELATEIQAALAGLSPQLRAAIVLVCLQGHSAAEAACIEDCSTDTMYWRIHEARRQLKELLAEHLQ
jgi:RNA polymerase sigma-70 factor, ECF subfamily